MRLQRTLSRRSSRRSPAEELFNAKVTVLGEYINHHVKEEQNEAISEA